MTSLALEFVDNCIKDSEIGLLGAQSEEERAIYRASINSFLERRQSLLVRNDGNVYTLSTPAKLLYLISTLIFTHL